MLLPILGSSSPKVSDQLILHKAMVGSNSELRTSIYNPGIVHSNTELTCLPQQGPTAHLSLVVDSYLI